MPVPILATKLYIPPPRPKVVHRPRLIELLNEGLNHRLTLLSAPAGFGKTTLLSEWVASSGRPTAWLSLDQGDNDPIRFLAHLVAALHTVVTRQSSSGDIGDGVMGVLQSPHPPPIQSILTALLNEIAAFPDNFILVLDDYYVIDSKSDDASTSVDEALVFLLEHLPPQMHLVIATREDPPLPLARLRGRDQLTELRATDLRFTPGEAAAFLNQVMGLNLSAEDIAALETRTEGWVAGLQLAALALQGLALQGTISMQGHQDAAGFIRSFTGSHHFVMDYLVEEVLGQQPASVQTFLLCTSILDRLCGPLCDAVCPAGTASISEGPTTVLEPAVSGKETAAQETGQKTLEYLEQANLFIVPLDDERRWYRYHHLFADLLRQRLHQNPPTLVGTERESIAELHRRASEWYENNGLEIEAFQHAVAANDIERAARLAEGEGMPLHFHGAVAPVLHWLESLPSRVMDARPSLWVIYASALLFVGHIAGVEQIVQAAEAALEAAGASGSAEPNDKNRDLLGHIASIRATLAVTQHDVENILVQSRRALEYLRPDNLPVRTATTWTLGYAYQLQGDRAAAYRAYSEAISISQAIGHFIITIMATLGLGNLQETDNQLYLAADTYRRVLRLASDPPLPAACEAHLGLARIYYQWNDLDAAGQYGLQSIQLARQIENTDRVVAGEVFLARVKLAWGDVAGAAAMLAEAGQSASRHNFVRQMPEVAAAQVLVQLRQDNLAAAAHLAEKHEIPISQARVHLALRDPSAALAALEPLHQQAEAKGWQDDLLQVMVLQAVAHHAHGEKERAVQLMAESLALAEPGGFIRIFVDEGQAMSQLLNKTLDRGIAPNYIQRVLTAFPTGETEQAVPSQKLVAELVEPLSQREVEILKLIGQGLSNREISERLFLALDTVKGHNRKIFSKLQVQSRTEAIARARELGLL